MSSPYLRAMRVIFILLCSILSYMYLRPFVPYFDPSGYKLLVACVIVIPCVLVYVESRIKVLFTQELVMGLFGLVCGLATSALILMVIPESTPEDTATALRVGTHLLLGYFGAVVGIRSAHRLDFTTSKFITPSERRLWGAKFLDTSVLIDGRIADMMETGFLEGLFIVPSFIVDELQALADSTNHLKRSKGRRGMDILSRLQSSSHIELEVLATDPSDTESVDKRLILLAKQHGGTVYTLDFNLCKMAEIEHVQTLNINQLSQSMKRAVLPGEILSVHILREGKEEHQGIGYLDDGTMVVVERGREFIGKEITVEVSSILQTAAGQMIFAQIYNGQLDSSERTQITVSTKSLPEKAGSGG